MLSRPIKSPGVSAPNVDTAPDIPVSIAFPRFSRTGIAAGCTKRPAPNTPRPTAPTARPNVLSNKLGSDGGTAGGAGGAATGGGANGAGGGADTIGGAGGGLGWVDAINASVPPGIERSAMRATAALRPPCFASNTSLAIWL